MCVENAASTSEYVINTHAYTHTHTHTHTHTYRAYSLKLFGLTFR
jgi:hypothetical protein